MKPIYFEIPYNGVKVSKAKFIIPSCTLPAKDWLLHNQIDTKSKDTEIVVFIRNPFERVILQYKHQLKHRPALRQYPISFQEWCKVSFQDTRVDKFMQNNPKDFLPQKKWIEEFESKNLSIHVLNKKCNIEGVKFASISIKDFYDEETRNLITSWYMEDFTLIDES